MDYIIRKCTESDLHKLVDLCQQHAAFEKANYNPEGKHEKLKKAIFSKKPMLNCLVAEVNLKVVGYATYTIDFSTWDAQKFIYLDCLYLEQEYRSFGIGRVLMDQVKNAGEKNGCINMQWQTPDFNIKAIKFYKKNGGTGREKLRFTLPIEN